VVDDEPTVRAVVVRTLREEGYTIVECTDGLSALEAATDVAFDLVITNRCMPRMSGDELSARLRLVYPDLPILHIEGYLHDDMTMSQPGEYYLDKPFSPDTLLEAVRGLLGERAG